MTIDAPIDAPPLTAPANSLLTSPILPTLLKLAIPRAERAADGGRNAAAHGARRHHLREHGEGKNQRDRRQRLGSETADIGRFGHRNQGGAEHGNRIGKCKF